MGNTNTNPMLQGGADLVADVLLGPPGQQPAKAWNGVYTGVVVRATGETVQVTIDNFDPSGNSTFTCLYEKRHGVTPTSPPRGTRCLVAFALNDAAGQPWAVAFAGWPSS
jgi:hypothetical protein